MANDQVFLWDPSILSKIKSLLKTIEGPILEVGAGSGNITKQINHTSVVAIEMDPQYNKVLNALENVTVVTGRAQDMKLDHDFKTMVSNLPFNQIMDILIHTLCTYPNLKSYYIIVPQKFYEKFRANTALGYKIRHMFSIKKMLDISGSCFKPKIYFSTVLLHLKPVAQVIDFKYLSFLSCVKRPNKKLKQVHTKKELSDIKDISVLKFLDSRLSDYNSQQLYKAYLNYRNNLKGCI